MNTGRSNSRELARRLALVKCLVTGLHSLTKGIENDVEGLQMGLDALDVKNGSLSLLPETPFYLEPIRIQKEVTDLAFIFRIITSNITVLNSELSDLFGNTHQRIESEE